MAKKKSSKIKTIFFILILGLAIYGTYGVWGLWNHYKGEVMNQQAKIERVLRAVEKELQ